MLPAALHVTRDQARRFHRRAVLLDQPVAGLDEVLRHHGYVQIDPINVCGRMQDHILRHRVTDYREGDLMRHLHGEPDVLPAERRTAFEHHLPDTGVLVAFPFEAWPHLHAAMQSRTRRPGAWSGRLTPTERALAEHILQEIAERGPLSSEHIADRRRARQRIWGSFSLAKSTLQKLFFHGRVLIARREHNRRLYDLPERVLPAAVLAQPTPAASETSRWLAHLKLRQRRLSTLKRVELPLIADLVQPVAVPDCPPLYCLREDSRLWDEVLSAAPTAIVPPRSLLIAPLDPLIYDRVLTSRLWEFDYTWEVYTPPGRRQRGYYALPLLAGTTLVGHVDPKADRERRRLTVVGKKVRRGHRIAGALAELKAFLGLC